MSKLLAPVVAGTLALFGLSASGAKADSGGTVAQLTGFHRMVVDSSAGYIFLSGSSGITVTDLSGNTITTLDTGNQAVGLALSSGSTGDILYAALTATGTSTSTSTSINSDSIDAIDVSTIKASSPTEGYYPLGNGDVPYGLAFQGGELWVSYTDSSGNAGIGSFDPGTKTFSPAVAGSSAATGWTTAPDLAADPQDGGTLVAVQPGSVAVAATYTTANGTLSPLAAQAPLGQCSDETQLAIVPGGAGFVAACGSSVNEYNVSDLVAGQSYAIGSDAPEGAAIDAGGTVAAGSSSGIYVYGSGGALDNIFHPGDSASLAAGGLAWEDAGAAGSQLVAVADSGGSYSLQVFSQPTLTRSTLTLTAPATAAIGSQIVFNGSLALGNGAALPSDTTPTVAITRTAPDGTSASLPPVQPGSNGSFTLTDTPTVTGAYTYTAKYAGGATIAAATASQAVTVSPLATSLSITTGATTFNYGATINVVAHLGATYTNRTVSIYAQWDGYKSKTLLKTGQVNSSGELAVSYTAPHSTTFSAVFTGDAHYPAKTVGHDVGVRATTTLGMAGYYGNKNVGGTIYRMYHQSGYLYVTVAVTPNKPGECARIEVQENYSGAWRANELTACAALDGSSRLYGYLTVNNGDLGYEYRVRADYVPSSSDVSNLSSDSGWQYIMPEK